MWTRSTAVFFSFFCSFLLLSFPDSITAQNNGDLRLSRGSISSTTYTSGRLEIYYNGQWGTVCDDSWGISDSNVACQQLGYSGAISPYYATSSSVGFGSGTGQIWLDNVGCTGSESRLNFCTNNGIGSHNCFHSEDVAIYCSSVRVSSTFTSPPTLTPTSSSGAAQNNGDLRLSRGSISSTTYTSGRLEIYYNGQWGTVCDDSWGISDSNVACQQLGYSGAISPYYATSSSVGFGSGTGRIWLDDVGCTGSESRLTYCTNNGIGSHNCFHSEDVAIYCSSVRISSTFTSPPTLTPTSTSGTVSQGDVRLVQGTFTAPSLSSGRVEIYINGEWGTVCDDLWGQTESDVVCRQLGFQRASSFGQADRNGFSQGTGEIWLDNVNCFSFDTSLLSCSHNGIGTDNCGHTEDIAVFCTNSPLTTGAIIGIAVGSALAGLCLCIIFVAVLCVCCSNSSSKHGTHRPLPVATTATAAYPTTTVVTGGQATSGTAYPTTGASPYPSQPPPQPGAYPAKGQDPPPPYPGQPIELQFTAPQPGYPEQPAPYPIKAPGPYPIDPNQPASYAGQPAPYPDQPAPYPNQPAPYPDQPAPYPDQPAPYPDQPALYPGQPAPYPGQPAPYPGQPAPYPGQLTPYSEQPAPYS